MKVRGIAYKVELCYIILSNLGGEIVLEFRLNCIAFALIRNSINSLYVCVCAERWNRISYLYYMYPLTYIFYTSSNKTNDGKFS